MVVRDADLSDRKDRAAAAEARLARVDRVARALDAALRIPGTRIRLGWDGIIGLLPWAGDTLTLLPALWIVIEGWHLGVTRRVLFRMLMNIAADWLIGLVPLLGDIFDIGWKANLRNARLIREDISGRV